MMRWTYLLLVCAACDGTSTSIAPTTLTPGQDDAGTGGASLDAGADASLSDGSVVDAAPSDGGGPTSDAAVDPLLPNPPAGFVQCKTGVISPSSAASACESYQPPLDEAKNCQGATASGGEWQVWCNGAERWVWARFDGVQATPGLLMCAGGHAFSGARQSYSDSSSQGGGGIPIVGCSGPLASTCELSDAAPETLTMAASSPAGTMTHSLYVTATPEPFGCPPPSPAAVEAVVLGVDITP